MYQITKQFTFSAAHHLPHMPEGHPCRRVHGHNYKVEIVIQSPCLDDRGFCQVDYLELAPFKKMIDDELDHKDLNEVLAPMRTTAENLARWLYERAIEITPFVKAVRVSETEKTWATYEP